MSGPEDVIEKFFPDPAVAPLGVGLHLDVPHDVYLRDPCGRPSLNSSVAKEIAADGALYGWHAHPLLGGSADGGGGTRSMDRGSIIHKLVLGRGQDFATVAADDWRKDWAKRKRTEIRGAGKIAVLAADMDDYAAEASIYTQKLRDDWGITFEGVQTEVTAIWQEDGVLCRARFDGWRPAPAELIIDDLKTIERANPRRCRMACHTYGYDLAGAHYIKGAEHLVADSEGRWTMRFIFLEGAPAYEPLVCEFAGTMRKVGEDKRRRAFDTWKACIGLGRERQFWPGRSRQVVRLEAMPWAVAEDTDAAFAAFTNPAPPF